MPTLRENYYNNRGLGMELLKEFEYDMGGDVSTPIPTDDVSTPVSFDTLPEDVKQLANEVVAKIKNDMKKGIKYSIAIDGAEIPIEKAILLKDKIKGEYEAFASENPADSHSNSNSFDIIRIENRKKNRIKLPIPMVMYILDNM